MKQNRKKSRAKDTEWKSPRNLRRQEEKKKQQSEVNPSKIN